MSSSNLFTVCFLFLLVQSLCSISQATVPASKTFKFVNEGEFGDFVVEYGGNYRVLSIFNSPFQLCFYNTTPNAYTLALRMATTRSESLFRWVWEANRGNPVRENATVTFGTDGNLILADADGRVVWQTGTANKGVVDFELLPNGNMVLLDSKGNFVWQSFDSPTDTLLVGQALRAGGVNKLVSRASAEDNSNGPYSMVLEEKGLSWYYKSPNSPKPMLYFLAADWFFVPNGFIEYVKFNVQPETDEFDNAIAYYLLLESKVSNSSSQGGRNLVRPKYNATLSFLRLGIDGNVRLFTYYDKVDSQAWQETYTLFSRDSGNTEEAGQECQLPERCGKFGLCSDNQCVACPTEKGLLGWSEECEPKKVTSCKPSDFHYYKLEGVEHFISQFTSGSGPIKASDCGKKCTSDCKCLGYFYYQETSKCWIVYDLKTLKKVARSTHVGYIKVPNN